VKALTQEQLEELGAQIILGNTYHLYLRPGHELIDETTQGGGLHSFMSWPHPILTDSGGFQVFSLSDLRKLTEEGVHFQSHIDGSHHLLSPEKSMEIQKALGSDIVMAFDECPALPSTPEKLKTSVDLTLRWAARCRAYPLHPHQHLFGIIQGGLDINLRRYCLEHLQTMNFDGYALGGLSVGEKNEEMMNFLQEFVPEMPQDKPRYLMGVGKPLDILNGIASGIDMFDCVLPCRNARNAQVFTKYGPINVKRAEFAKDTRPLDPDCTCKVCQRYSRAYVRHLYMVGEYLAGTLMTYHNIHFYLQMVRDARSAILKDQFDDYYQTFYKNYSSSVTP
jgi:queuine tRNA-ribosyltransferase